MKAMVCEMCGSGNILKQDGFYVCQSCDTKYTVEEAKKLMVEGTVKIDNTDYVSKYLNNAHRALAKEDWEEVEKYYNMVEQNVTDNMEAVFFSSYGKAMLAMTDDDYFKREQKFEVLNRSMSVISDYYETTTENKEEVLRKIAEYIKKMYNVTFVYQRQSLDLGGAIRALSATTGSKQWCVNLINNTKATFVEELRQISRNHDEPYLRDIINSLYPEQSNAPQQNASPQATGDKKALTGMILGVVGTIAAWLLALLGYVLGGIGLVLSIKVYKEDKNDKYALIGIITSSIALVSAIMSSIIGIMLM